MAARQVPQADRTLFGPRREAATPAGRPPRTTQNRSPKIKAPISEPLERLAPASGLNLEYREDRGSENENWENYVQFKLDAHDAVAG